MTSSHQNPAGQSPASDPTARQTMPRAAGDGSSQRLFLWPSEQIDVPRFNVLFGDEAALHGVGQPVDNMSRLFVKRVILDDSTTLDVATIKVPGFIGIFDGLQVKDPAGNSVSGHADIARFLARDGLLLCTYQWHKERYGVPIDTRQPPDPAVMMEAFLKNEEPHAGILVPAQRPDASGNQIESFASMNEPSHYHQGMFGEDGFVAVA